MKTAKSLVILATIRSADFLKEYVENALQHNFKLNNLEFLVLTEDFVDKGMYKRVFDEYSLEGQILNQKDRDKSMGEMGLAKYNELIPEKHRAEESFGLIYMWKNKYGYGFTMDDDTLPVPEYDFFGEHFRNLEFKGVMSELKSNKGFVNVLYKNFGTHKLYPRGYPYACTGEKLTGSKAKIETVGISQGLWTNIPDLDAVRILFDGDLNGQSTTRLNPSDYGENFTAAFGNYITVCSMNLAFRREILPAFYQYRMGTNPWKVDRFDDIWSGIVAKKFMDSKKYRIINGTPLCRHNKAPRSTFKDLLGEAAGLEANEVFYKVVDQADTSSNDDFEKVEAISKEMEASTHPFIKYCGNHLHLWLEALMKVG